jgi:hypothetical protein
MRTTHTGVSVSTTVMLDGHGWFLATDPDNVGSQQKWYSAPQVDAKPVSVPNVIQEVFPLYHGVAWY